MFLCEQKFSLIWYKCSVVQLVGSWRVGGYLKKNVYSAFVMQNPCISSGCHDKVDSLNNRNLFISQQFWRLENLRSRCQIIQISSEDSFADGHLPVVSSPGKDGEKKQALFSSCRDTNPIFRDPPTHDLFLNRLPSKGPLSKCYHIWVWDFNI